VQKVDLSQGRF